MHPDPTLRVIIKLRTECRVRVHVCFAAQSMSGLRSQIMSVCITVNVRANYIYKVTNTTRVMGWMSVRVGRRVSPAAFARLAWASRAVVLYQLSRAGSSYATSMEGRARVSARARVKSSSVSWIAGSCSD